MLTPADDKYHCDKHEFTVPFVCGARDLGEALRRIAEGAAMIRSKGEAGSGNIVEAVRHIRAISDEIANWRRPEGRTRRARARPRRPARTRARGRARDGKLPVVLFCAGGVSTPADAALMMQLGAEGIFVGSGIFKSKDPEAFAKAIVDATTHYDDPAVVVAAHELAGAEAMPGSTFASCDESELLALRAELSTSRVPSPSASWRCRAT